MDNSTVLALVTALAQFGLGAAAWKLANALKVRTDDNTARLDRHEVRLVRLEETP